MILEEEEGQRVGREEQVINFAATQSSPFEASPPLNLGPLVVNSPWLPAIVGTKVRKIWH